MEVQANTAPSSVALPPTLDKKTEPPIEDTNSTLPEDARSSSLSELGDDPENEQPEFNDDILKNPPEEPESEAETERLENSPQKLREHKNVILGSIPRIFGRSPSKLAQETKADVSKALETTSLLVDKISTNGDNIVTETQINDIPEVSIEGPGPEATEPLSPTTLASKKRKRLSHDGRSVSAEFTVDEPARKRTGSVKSDAEEETHKEIQNGLAADIDHESHTEPQESIPEYAIDKIIDGDNLDVAREESYTPSPTKSHKAKKGKRKGRKPKEVEAIGNGDDEGVDSSEQPEAPDHITNLNGDEDALDEAELAAREEAEVTRKKTAMDALGAIEKQFAIFKEKLYDDRLAQVDKELESLTQPNPTHPEYLAMVECIDERRDRKLNYEQTLLRFKAQSLKTTAVATRAHIHSQFYQDARKIREDILEEAGKQWMQIHRDRSAEKSVEYGYKFPARRSEQIKQQAAYNLEVSILSGLAKYVGFPAAPELKGATSLELDEDNEKMGISIASTSTPYRSNVPNHVPPRGGPFSMTPSLLPKHNKAAIMSDEHAFGDQMTWANSQNSLNPHLVQYAQNHNNFPNGQLITPAGQKRVTDLTGRGSASTIPDMSSAPNSSVGGTPVNVEERVSPTLLRRRPNHPVSNSTTPLEVREGHAAAIADSRLFSKSASSSPVTHRKTLAENSQFLSAPARAGGPQGAYHPRSTPNFGASNGFQTSNPRTGIFGSPAPKDNLTPGSAKSNDDMVRRNDSLPYMHGLISGSGGISRFGSR
ncbi:MAG: hypothetical protein M1834_007759 [Cirrosporium novae-zelandiae]|nr:MAG: hypothetical protein M1834_007759 [Cirrosporium novae-zelandiae]